MLANILKMHANIYNIFTLLFVIHHTIMCNCFTLTVPISNVTLTRPRSSNLSVIEDFPVTLECVTDGGLPTPEVNWYWHGSSGTANLTEAVNVIRSRDNLNFTTSKLTIRTSRSDNGKRILCAANNTIITHVSDVVLNVQCEYSIKQTLFF